MGTLRSEVSANEARLRKLLTRKEPADSAGTFGSVIGSDRAALGEPDSSALFCVYSGPETLSAGPETLSARLLRAG